MSSRCQACSHYTGNANDFTFVTCATAGIVFAGKGPEVTCTVQHGDAHRLKPATLDWASAALINRRRQPYTTQGYRNGMDSQAGVLAI